ncbi:helix-turn-helix domain-containing protein [Weissella paramesenteroides]|uniref:helix-turn-helix domain-containing protein n=2 Tax=Weissella paramesenteroides TaxID=1249 RepID=UPI00388F54C3
MNWLLSKKDEERLALHQYLITHHSKTFLIKDLIKAMNWSRYLVLQAVQQLNVDYQAITKSSQIFITIADANRTMTLHNLQLISVGALKGYYLRQSLKFELLLDVFLEDVHSNETIAFRHSSSTTVVRTMKEEVRDQLLLQGINIADNYKLVGDERQIRTMMVEQIYIAFANEQLPFSAATLSYVKQVQHDVIPLLTKRATIKRVLEITIGVWHTRVSNHHHIQPTDENLLRPTEQLQCPTKHLMGKFASYLKFRLDPEDDWVEDELRYGVAVCYALGIGHTQDYLSDLTDENQEKVDWAIQRIGRAYGHYFMKQLPEEQKQAIKDLMGPALIRLCYFPPYDIQPLPDIDFQMKTYPIHTAFTKQVVHIFTRRFDYDEQQLMSILFNPLLNAFIKVFDVREIFPLITVTIDLIDMPALENYLTQMVAQWDTLNLRITNQLTKKTDFYLSNVMISEKIPGFAWQSIPEWSEQLALRQQMIDLTTRRFYKW